MGLFRIRQNVGLLNLEETRSHVLYQWNLNLSHNINRFEIVDVDLGHCLWFENRQQSIGKWSELSDTDEKKGGIVTALLRFQGSLEQARNWYYAIDKSTWATSFEEISELELIAEAKEEVEREADK